MLRACLVLAIATVALMGLPMASMAQNPALFQTWTEQPTRAPAGGCRALRGATTYEFSIDAATLVAAQGTVPEYCLVQGIIAPEVRFEVALPSLWNGRFYMFGNGGFAGEPLDAPLRLDWRDKGIRAGFAVAQTNTGHENARDPLASFARSPQKLVDFAYRAVHVTAMTAKALIARYYAAPPDKSYFGGCSTGGRQGLMSAQRFPADFDGILAGAPVYNFTGIFVQFAGVQRRLAETPLDAAKVRVLSEAVVSKCDALDGVADGVIEDPRACTFNPATDVRACGAGEESASCVTPAELKVFEAFGALRTEREEVFPAFPAGTGLLAPHGSIPGTTPAFWIGAEAGSKRFVDNFFRDMATPGSPTDWRSFDPNTGIEKLQPVAAILNATDPDVEAFRARGGKLLMYHGWAEPQINPMLSVNYYGAVHEKFGARTEDFARLFMMPGMLHCQNGPGPDVADMMTPLVQWVERGIAPTRIVASKVADGAVVRTRPVCPYPQVARYKGTGSTDAAENFECAPLGSRTAN